jgi:NTE family protein
MHRAALVLSGGGILGVGWELGVLRGLSDASVDMGLFDPIIGTSAGAIVGAMVASGRTLEPVPPDPARDAALVSFARQVDVEAMGPLFAALGAGGEPDQARRAELGALASRSTLGEPAYVDLVRRFLPDEDWPGRLRIAAVDVQSGAFVTWGADARVHLVLAAAASSAVPGLLPPITVAGRRYMDGAMRSPTSADLAVGSDFVLIVAAPSRTEATDRQIAEETAGIRAAGGRVVEIRPDMAAIEAFGSDPMDGTRLPLLFETGRRQGNDASGDVIAGLAGPA